MDELTVLDTQVADELFYIDGKSHSVQDYLSGVDMVLHEIESTGDFEIGANTVRSMSSVGHAIGISKAKLLHGMWTIWQERMKADSEDAFFNYVSEFCGMTNRVVVQRYIQAWEAVLIAPPTLYEDMLAQPMKNLNALGSAIAQGFEITDDTWENVATTTNNNEFLKIIRSDVKGKEPRKNSITIYLEKDGSLVAWQDGNTSLIGVLQMRTGNVKAIERIIKSAGIVVR